MLFLASFFSAIDRSVLGVLIEPIRRDLSLTDQQVGALAFAFAVFYALMGLPLGRLTDTKARARILSVSLAVYSVATALCGAAQNFLQLFLGRVMVGVGEAGGVPSSYSLVGDSFPPQRRASALALINSGLGIGGFMGLMLAGFLADRIGWRMTLAAFGVPGLLLAVAVWFTVTEPPRGAFEADKGATTDMPSLRESVRALAGNRTLVHIVLGYSVMSFGLFGVGYWLPAFLMRSHHLTLTQVGLYYGAMVGAAMVAGLVVSALTSTWFLRQDRRWEVWLPGVVNLLVAPCYLGMFVTDSLTVVLALSGICTFLLGVTVGPASAAIQSSVSARMRGMAVAITMFFSAAIGQGVAPWAIGFASDWLMPVHGKDSLKVALMYSPVFFLFGGVLYLMAGRSFNRTRVD